MIGKLTNLLALAAVFVVLVFLANVTVLSYQAAAKMSTLEPNKPVVSPVLSEETQVLNASYSAVPTLKEKIASQKYTSKPAQLVTKKGDNLLVLVDKSISLPESYAPKDLVSLKGLVPAAAGSVLRKEAADHLTELFAAANQGGFNLSVVSAYRSYQTQISTFNYWVKVVGYSAAVRVSAIPGHSQHQLGTAVDFSSPSVSSSLSELFGSTPDGKWVAANAWKFGFVMSYPSGKEPITGYSYEPWHFRYIGLGPAAQLHSLGWDLETYLKEYGVW